MIERRVYHVKPSSFGWQVVTGDDVVSSHLLLRAAVRAARAAAHACDPSHVVIHHPDGSFETEYPGGHNLHTTALPDDVRNER